MTAFNIVRFRVKRGRQKKFIAAHRRASPGFKGFRGGLLVRTGEQTFCFVGEWTNFARIVEARQEMIALLDTLRDDLENLGRGLGVTDPVSGEMVLRLPATRGGGRRGGKRRKTAARKKRR